MGGSVGTFGAQPSTHVDVSDEANAEEPDDPTAALGLWEDTTNRWLSGDEVTIEGSITLSMPSKDMSGAALLDPTRRSRVAVDA
jgi:hypothetical protein